MKKTIFTRSKSKAKNLEKKGWKICKGTFYCQIEQKILDGWYCTQP